MEIAIKQLKQNGLIFVPQTVAEAVLVKANSGEVITLDNLLKRKIEKIEVTNELNSVDLDNGSFVITHTSKIAANETTQPLLVKHNESGHIIETAPFGKILITVDGVNYTEHNGSTNSVVLLGDDFEIDESNNNIKLKWNNI